MHKLLQSMMTTEHATVTLAGIEFQRMTDAIYKHEDEQSISIWTPLNPYQYQTLTKASNTVRHFALTN